MKKNLEKVFASASIVVAIVLIMILLVTAFGGIEFKEFESNLVRGLLITLGILYLLLAGISLTLVFLSNDAVKEIILRTEQKGSVRASIGVVRKMVKTTCADVEGLKCTKVGLVTDEYGVRLKVNVKVIDKDVVEIETYVRTLLEDVFLGALGFRFHTIEIKVTSLQPRYKVDKEKIDKAVAERLAEIKSDEEKLSEVIESAENQAVSETAAEKTDTETKAAEDPDAELMTLEDVSEERPIVSGAPKEIPEEIAPDTDAELNEVSEE